MSSRGGLMEEGRYTMKELIALINELPDNIIVSIDLEVEDDDDKECA